MTTICVFGGTGFLGRRLVRRCAAASMTIRIAARHPDRDRGALAAESFEHVTPCYADVRDRDSVAAAVAGTDAVVNAVSAYVEKGDIGFTSVHERGAETLAREAAAAGVSRFVLVSGIGADPASASAYISARGRGEALVRQAFPSATIVRPGAMFGPGDALFGTLAEIAGLLPVLPLIGGGRTRLQPVYVEDVAQAISRMLADSTTAGRTYELAGPRVYTLRELTELALRILDKRRPMLPVPFVIAEIQARLFELLPSPPLTTAQVELLKVDNVASDTHPGFADLGMQPQSIEDIVPGYLGRSRAAESDRQ